VGRKNDQHGGELATKEALQRRLSKFYSPLLQINGLSEEERKLLKSLLRACQRGGSGPPFGGNFYQPGKLPGREQGSLSAKG